MYLSDSDSQSFSITGMISDVAMCNQILAFLHLVASISKQALWEMKLTVRRNCTDSVTFGYILLHLAHGFCVSRKGGTGGSGWGNSPSAVHI